MKIKGSNFKKFLLQTGQLIHCRRKGEENHASIKFYAFPFQITVDFHIVEQNKIIITEFKLQFTSLHII